MQKFLYKYRLLPGIARRMILVFWLYFFFQMVTDIFIGAYIILETKSFLSLLFFRWLYFFGAFLGFAIFGIFFPRIGISMKWSYFGGFVSYLLSNLFLLVSPHDMRGFIVFGCLQGLAVGMFWLGVHAHELRYIPDDIRDFYSSIQHAGVSVLKIVIPILASALLIVSYLTGQSSIFFLLIFLILLSTVSLPIILPMSSFLPPKVSYDVLHQTHTHTHRSVLLYYGTSSYRGDILLVVATFFSLLVLQTMINIGIWESIIGVLSVFLILWIAPLRSHRNRKQIMLIGLIGSSFAAIFLALSPYSGIFFALYAIVIVFSNPLTQVSQHVIDLKTMESSNRHTNSYISMIYREFIIFFGRTFFVLILFLICLFIIDDIDRAHIFLGVYILLSLFVYIFVSRLRNTFHT